MLFLDRGFPSGNGISLQGFKGQVIFLDKVQHTRTIQAIYGYGQVKLKVNWPDKFENSNIWLKC